MDYFRVACGRPEIRIGRPDRNRPVIQTMLEEMAEKEVDLAFFPDQVLTGCALGDMGTRALLCQRAWEEATQLAIDCEGLDLMALVGLPIWQEGGGRPGLVLLYRGEVHRLSGDLLKIHRPNGPSITIGLCRSPEGRPLPSPHHALVDFCLIQRPQALLPGLSARRRQWAELFSRSGSAVAMLSANRGETTTDQVYADGGLIAEGGKVLAEAQDLSAEAFFYADLDLYPIRQRRAHQEVWPGEEDQPQIACELEWQVPYPGRKKTLTRAVDPYPFCPKDPTLREETLTIQSQGLVQRMKAIGCLDLWLGLSGGLDSTLALLVARRAMKTLDLPLSGLHAVSMPAFGSSDRTKTNAERLGQALGVDFRIIALEEALQVHFRSIGLKEGDRSVAFENAQARERTQILFDLANLHGGLVVGTGDLSEIALGWSTYNGDHMSSYSVNASIPKTLARDLVRHEADRHPEWKDLLLDIVDTPVSPELLPPVEGEIAQKTEELIGPYALHDFFLYYFYCYGAEPGPLFAYAKQAFPAYAPKEILSVMALFFRRFSQNQFKRSCMVDGARATAVSLSPRGAWSMPSDFDGGLYLAEIEALQESC